MKCLSRGRWRVLKWSMQKVTGLNDEIYIFLQNSELVAILHQGCLDMLALKIRLYVIEIRKV